MDSINHLDRVLQLTARVDVLLPRAFSPFAFTAGSKCTCRLPWHDDIFEAVMLLLPPLSRRRLSPRLYPTVRNNFIQRTRYALETRYRGRDKFFRVPRRGWLPYLLSENCTAARKDKYLIPCFVGSPVSPRPAPSRFMNRSENFTRRVKLNATFAAIWFRSLTM